MLSLPHADLNPAQRQAVLHPGGPLLILAGAGSGKTRVITCRLAELVRRGVDPKRILAVTFTNKAAGEMRERTQRLLHGAEHGMWIGTFHATCARLLRIHAARAGLPRDFAIFDDADQLALCGQVLKELDLSEHVATPRTILSAIDQAKNGGVRAEEYRGGDFLGSLVARVYPEYQRRLRGFGAVDFGDLLLLPLQLAQSDPQVAEDLARRFEHVLVDEFQDTNRVQYRLLTHLAGRSRNVCVVGDDDQAIYGWRGADVRNLLDFEKDWPDATVIKLEQNYRSTKVILEAANAVIARNPHRHGKHLYTEREGGALLVYHTAADERREALFVADTIARMAREEGRAAGDFALCYRVNAQSRALEEALRERNLPYTVIGGTRFYDRAEVKDILAYLRLCQNPADEVALRRVINTPTRGIGDVTVAKIEAQARAGGITLYQALSNLVHSDEVLTKRARSRLRAFLDLLEDLRRLPLDGEGDLLSLAEAVVERSGYLEWLALDSGPEALARRENVMELLGSIRARKAEGLVEYLEQIALVSAVDTSSRGVALLTVHAAKGLEFPVVFVTGLEEGLFPSLRRREEYGAEGDPIAEERRLAYVAITRARDCLILTNARLRRLFGQLYPAEPSRFLREIPASCLAPVVQADEEYRREEVAGYHVEPDPDGPDVPVPPRSRESSDDGLHIVYDEEEVPRQGAFQLGQRVYHEDHGQGEVRAFHGRGRNLRLVVYFPTSGRVETVMARFLSAV